MNSILTLLGVFIAIYSLIPRHKRIELSLRIGIVVTLICTFLLFFIIYLYSISLLDKLKIELFYFQPELNLYRDPIALWIFLLIIIILVFKWSIFSLHRYNLHIFKNLISQLIDENRIMEMAELFMKYHKNIFKYAETNSKYYNYRVKMLQKYPDQKHVAEIMNKLFDKMKINKEGIVKQISKKNNIKLIKIIYHTYFRLKYAIIRNIILLLPEGLDKVNMAIEIIRLAIISPKTLQYWTRERPRELIKLLDYKIYHRCPKQGLLIAC